MKEKLLAFWHDLYYKFCTKSGEDFAMTCKEAVGQMNSTDSSHPTLAARFRLRLHLSLCRACTNYHHASRILGNAAKILARKSENTVDIEKLNQELIEKYVSKNLNDPTNK